MMGGGAGGGSRSSRSGVEEPCGVELGEEDVGDGGARLSRSGKRYERSSGVAGSTV